MATNSTQNSDQSSIDAQIRHLINNSPDVATSTAMQAIAPILKAIALNQKHLKYFLLQSPTGNLILTTLSQVSNPKISKKVIYAYSSEAIALQNQDLKDSVIKEIEIVSLLFQLLGMQEIDSLIIGENLPKEIKRQKLYDLCQTQLKMSSNIA